MYTVNWSRKNGRRRITNSKEFDDFKKAVDFLRRRELNIISDYWAGGYVEDTKGRKIFSIE